MFMDQEARPHLTLFNYRKYEYFIRAFTTNFTLEFGCSHFGGSKFVRTTNYVTNTSTNNTKLQEIECFYYKSTIKNK